MTKKLCILLIGVIVAVAGGCATGTVSTSDREEAKIHYRMGNVYFKDGDYPSALEELTIAVELNPTEATYHNLLGVTYFVSKKMYAEAISHLKEAVRLDPEYSDAHINLSAIYLDMKQWDDAITHSEAALDNIFFRTPERAHNNIGQAYHGKGLYAEALKHFKEAVKAREDFAFAYSNMGLTLKELGRLDDAVIAHKKAIEIMPSATFYFNLGKAYIAKKEKDEAIKAFSKVVEMAPGSNEAASAQEYIGLLR